MNHCKHLNIDLSCGYKPTHDCDEWNVWNEYEQDGEHEPEPEVFCMDEQYKERWGK
jgi:hypothetical protein